MVKLQQTLAFGVKAPGRRGGQCSLLHAVPVSPLILLSGRTVSYAAGVVRGTLELFLVWRCFILSLNPSHPPRTHLIHPERNQGRTFQKGAAGWLGKLTLTFFFPSLVLNQLDKMSLQILHVVQRQETREVSESKLQTGNHVPLSGDVGGGPVPNRGGHGSQGLEPGLFKND